MGIIDIHSCSYSGACAPAGVAGADLELGSQRGVGSWVLVRPFKRHGARCACLASGACGRQGSAADASGAQLLTAPMIAESGQAGQLIELTDRRRMFENMAWPSPGAVGSSVHFLHCCCRWKQYFQLPSSADRLAIGSACVAARARQPEPPSVEGRRPQGRGRAARSACPAGDPPLAVPGTVGPSHAA